MPVALVHQQLADELAHAEATRRPVPPLTARHPDLTVDDAYAVQEVNTRRRLAAGEWLVGRKVGLTSLAMQRQLGVDEPDFGALLSTMVLADGGAVPLDRLVAPRIEAEIAVRLGTDLAGGDVDLDAARRAVSEVMLAFEVIDSRIADWQISLVDTIADNASSARVVVGPARSPPRRTVSRSRPGAATRCSATRCTRSPGSPGACTGSAAGCGPATSS
jgi:2-keto-4-pentenoate hydratase